MLKSAEGRKKNYKGVCEGIIFLMEKANQQDIQKYSVWRKIMTYKMANLISKGKNDSFLQGGFNI